MTLPPHTFPSNRSYGLAPGKLIIAPRTELQTTSSPANSLPFRDKQQNCPYGRPFPSLCRPMLWLALHLHFLRNQDRESLTKPFDTQIRSEQQQQAAASSSKQRSDDRIPFPPLSRVCTHGSPSLSPPSPTDT